MNDTICSFIAHNYFLTTPSFTKNFVRLTKTINSMNDTICSFIVHNYFFNGTIVHKKFRSLTKTLPFSMFRNISHLYPRI